jgi:hypothetical protein
VATTPSPIDADLIDLARIAALGTPEDLRLLLNRLIRKYRAARPDLSRRLDAILIELRKQRGMAGVLRTIGVDDSPNPD